MNVGAVCRSMMNFGFRDLRLVNPCSDYFSLQAKKMALKADSILENARVFPTVQEALADCRLCFGTTRRFGKYRETFFSPEEAAGHTCSQPSTIRTAFVFGREDRGLHTSELDLCQRFVTIPTHEAYPSMNLSQAVTLVLYELRKASMEKTVSNEGQQLAAKAENVENMFQHMRRTLVEIDYLDHQNPDHILRSFRRLFGRTQLDEREVRILQGLWSRIDWIEAERRKCLDKTK